MFRSLGKWREERRKGLRFLEGLGGERSKPREIWREVLRRHRIFRIKVWNSRGNTLIIMRRNIVSRKMNLIGNLKSGGRRIEGIESKLQMLLVILDRMIMSPEY